MLAINCLHRLAPYTSLCQVIFAYHQRNVFILEHYIIYETSVTTFDRPKVYITFDGAANFRWQLKRFEYLLNNPE